jgi:hypothetical protein
MRRFIKKIVFNWQAQTAHGLHSPFVFQLYCQVLNPHLQKGFQREVIIEELKNYFQIPTIYLSKKTNEYQKKIIIIDMQNYQLFEIKLDQNPDQFSESILLIFQPHKELNTFWTKLIQHPKVNFSIDIFELGIITTKYIAPNQSFKLKKSS